MAIDTVPDKYQAIGSTGSTDTLSASPIGTVGSAAGPYLPGQNGCVPPVAADRLTHYPLNPPPALAPAP